MPGIRPGRRLAPLVVFARRRTEQDPLDLGRRAAAEPERRLDALVAQLAGVQGATKLVQRREILLGHVLARRLDQDQVAGPALRGRGAQEGLALLGREALAREHDGLTGLQTFLE